MPDSKITALASIGTGTDPANDPLVIVDVSDTTMAASGTTKKVSLNNLLACSPTATLASATITGDLTVDTSTLKVDSLNNRVGIGTATPAAGNLLHISGTAAVPLLMQRTGSNDVYLSFTDNSGLFGYFGFSNGDLRFQTPGSGYANKYVISSDGTSTWSNVGGVAGTAMTLNSTGLGVGGSPAARIHAIDSGGGCALFTRAAAPAAALSAVYIQAPVSSGFSSSPVLNFWYQNTGISNPANECFAIRTNGANRLYIDDQGQVGVGVTPSTWWVGFKAYESSNGVALLAQTNVPFAHLVTNAYDGATNWKYKVSSNYGLRYAQDGTTGNHLWFNAGLGTAGNNITWTQAMTLDASGNLLVGKSSLSIPTVGFQVGSAGIAESRAGTTNSDNSYILYSTGATAYRFYVGMGGTVFATNTTISAISDARLKENVQDIDVGLGAILALKPRKFDWKAGKGKDIKGDRGFIAQEFEQVFPNLIDEWKDAAPEGEAPYKSVRQDLIPVLVKAIQELTARVQTLEAK